MLCTLFSFQFCRLISAACCVIIHCHGILILCFLFVSFAIFMTFLPSKYFLFFSVGHPSNTIVKSLCRTSPVQFKREGNDVEFKSCKPTWKPAAKKKRMTHFYFQVSMSRAQVNCNKQKTVDEFGRMRQRMRRK